MAWITLTVVDDKQGWRVSLGTRSTRPVEGRSPSSAVATALAAARALRDVPPVLLPGRDARRSRQEAEAGRALGAVLLSTPEVGPALSRHLGAAQERAEPLIVAVDAPQARLRGLPWELLALGGPPLESLGQAVMVRLGGGHARARGTCVGLEVRTWSPDPADAVCAGVLDALGQGLDAVGLPQPQDRPADPQAWRVLHVVAHGRHDQGQTVLLLPGQPGADTAAHALRDHLEGVDLVLLDTCEAATSDREDQGLAGRLLAAGVPAVLAPVQRTSAEATRALAVALYASLARGDSLARAVAEGRRAVRSLARPHPDARWANTGLWVGDLRVLEAPPVAAPGWRPAGWPLPSPAAAALLQRAREAAEASGYVGVEALAQVGSRSHPAVDAVRHGRPATPPLRPVSGRQPRWEGTPRLVALAGRLRQGFGPADLWDALWSDPGGLVQVVAALPADTTRTWSDTMGPLDASPPAACLEVVGGPEDGRRLRPEPGQVLGRHAPASRADLVLYRDTAVVDPFLSRRALVWVGPGRVRLGREARRVRQGVPSPVGPGEVELRAEDQLVLTELTRVRGLP